MLTNRITKIRAIIKTKLTPHRVYNLVRGFLKKRAVKTIRTIRSGRDERA
jgi:hypothetical protein